MAMFLKKRGTKFRHVEADEIFIEVFFYVIFFLSRSTKQNFKSYKKKAIIVRQDSER